MDDRPIIAIDVDDVLAFHAEAFVEFSNQQWGTGLVVDDYDDDWAKVWRLDRETDEGIAEIERRAACFFDVCFADMGANRAALAALSDLSKRFDLIVVTARRLHTKADTHAWIHRHFPGIFLDDNIHYAGIWETVDPSSLHKTKKDILIAKRASYLIDDQPKHCNAAAESGMKALLFGDYAWNQSNEIRDGVVRVRDWASVKDYFFDAN